MKQIIQLQDVTKDELFQHLENIIEQKLKPITNLNKNEKKTVQEVANECDVTVLTVHNWIKKGYLKAFKIGRRVYVKREDFDEALKEVKSLKYKRN